MSANEGDSEAPRTDSTRKSSYPMIDVADALNRVFSVVTPLPPKTLTIMQAAGYVCAENIHAIENFPSFPASIMDGYAVVAPQAAGVFKVVERIHAGDTPGVTPLTDGFISYITTGGQLPLGANAVVKIEDTVCVDRLSLPGSAEKLVEIKVAVKPGAFVRQIGSDISQNELILPAGQVIKAAEVGNELSSSSPLLL